MSLKRRKRKETNETPNVNLQISTINPLTSNQKRVFQSYNRDKNLFLHGMAGTGKTFLSIYLALDEVLDKKSPYHNVVIIRSVVPTRDMGFLPGNQKEKMKVYESPYYAICTELFNRGDAYDLLKHKNIIQFMSTSFVRGITLKNCIVIVDEAQNMDSMELHSIMTRVGEDCKIIFCGDYRQDDLSSERKRETSGIRQFMSIIKEMREFDLIEFEADDIVRSGLVKSYIITRDNLGL